MDQGVNLPVGRIIDADHHQARVVGPCVGARTMELLAYQERGGVLAFRDTFLSTLGGLGYPVDQASAVASRLLPDLLTYDWGKPPGFPNGRRLTDDTADWLLVLLTRGRLTSDTVGPHADLLDVFPYLGPPHRSLRT